MNILTRATVSGLKADMVRFAAAAVRRKNVLFARTLSVKRPTDVARTPSHVTLAFCAPTNTIELGLMKVNLYSAKRVSDSSLA